MEPFLPEDLAEDADRRARASPQVTDRLDACAELRAAGIQIDGVLADAAYGNVHAFQTAIDRMGLRYAVGVASRLTVQVTGMRRRCKIGRMIKQLPSRAWRWVAWGHWPPRSLHRACAPPRGPECWLLAERPLTTGSSATPPAEPAGLGVAPRARSSHTCSLAHRTALSGAEGRTRLDHFKGRSYRGGNHHAPIAALAFAFLQLERRLGTKPLPTFPGVRHWVRDIVAALSITFAH
jgi:hypothetical protein